MNKFLRTTFLIVLIIFVWQCRTKERMSKPQSVYFAPNKNDTLINKVLVDELANDFLSPFLIRSKDEKESLEFEFSLTEPKLFKI